MSLDKFSMNPDEVSAGAGGPNRGACLVQLSRTVQFEVVSQTSKNSFQHFNLILSQEDYIVQSVDLLSGLGGAMGLWLGWSVLSLGNSIVKAF